MMNLEAGQESGRKLPVIWDNIGGLLTSSEELNQQRTDAVRHGLSIGRLSGFIRKTRPIENIEISGFSKTIAPIRAARSPRRRQADFPNSYINDWRWVGVPLEQHPADKASGWGA